MFTQRISMDCTKEQYEKYLKEELLKMGYKETEIDGLDWADDFIIINDFIELGRVTQLANANKDTNDRHYLGSFNAPLFLALAAMTYGERVFGYREWRKQKNGDKWALSEAGVNYNSSWRKATKEEIMERFGEKIGHSSDFTYKTEAEMISLLKSKGYKILRKTEIWKEV